MLTLLAYRALIKLAVIYVLALMAFKVLLLSSPRNRLNAAVKTNSLAAEDYRNTCEITTAIHQEGELTRGLITQNTIQDLRDRLADRDRDLVEANNQISQYNQTQYLVNILKPRAIPSYGVCNSQCGCGGTYNTYNG